MELMLEIQSVVWLVRKLGKDKLGIQMENLRDV